MGVALLNLTAIKSVICNQGFSTLYLDLPFFQIIMTVLMLVGYHINIFLKIEAKTFASVLLISLALSLSFFHPILVGSSLYF